MKMLMAISLLFFISCATLLFGGCATLPQAHNPPTQKTPASRAETASIVKSLQGQELDCVSVDGINTHLNAFREVKGRYYATMQTMASHPSEMQITTANHYPGNPKALQFWFPYGTGTMAANTFSVTCGN